MNKGSWIGYKSRYSNLFWIIAIIIAALVVVNLVWILKVLLYPQMLDYSEGIPYFLTVGHLYKSFTTYPYLITYYTPLYYVLFDAFRPLVQVGALPYFYGRLFNIVAEAIGCCLIYLVAIKVAKVDRFRALLAPALFFSFYYLYGYVSFSNPEIFEVIFGLLAMLFLASRGRGAAYLAGLSLSVAFLFKQTALILLVPVLVYFLIMRDWRRALKFLFAFAIVAVPAVVWLSIATQGRFIFSVFVIPSITPYSLSGLNLWLYIAVYTPFLAILLMAVNGKAVKKNLLLFLVLVFELLSTLSIAKWGSNYTYFMFPLAVACIYAVISLEDVFRKGLAGRYLARALLIFWIFVFCSVMLSLNIIAALPQINQGYARQVALMGGVQGNALIEYPGLALEANKSLVFESSIFWVLEQHGLWNDSNLIQDVRAQKFAAIAETPGGRFYLYPGLANAINSSYFEKSNLSGIDLYLPDPRNSS